jgi:hypothetical protein
MKEAVLPLNTYQHGSDDAREVDVRSAPLETSRHARIHGWMWW